jgi:hypothetical protein
MVIFGGTDWASEALMRFAATTRNPFSLLPFPAPKRQNGSGFKTGRFQMTTKKTRKSNKPRQSSSPPRFSVGDQVRVKTGVADPDFPDIPLGGWAGAITEIDRRARSPLYLVEWNQSTLDNRHPIYLKRCERDGLEEEHSWLGEADLEAEMGDPVPMEQPTNIVTRPLRPNDQDDRIRAIFGLTSDDPLPEPDEEFLEKYYEYLKTTLTFPFEATYSQDTGPFESRKCTVNIIGLVEPDECCVEDGYGLIAKIQRHRHPQSSSIVQSRGTDRKTLLGFMSKMFWGSAPEKEDFRDDRFVPLGEIEDKKNSPNHRLIADYAYWFHNF